MSNGISGVVQAVSRKERNTKNGPATVWSVMINDTWYGGCWNDPGVNKGDTVEFNIKVNGQYTNIDGRINKIASGDGGSNQPAPPAKSGGSGGAKKWGCKCGKFPINPLDGQVSIIRQNALTNARELLTNYHNASTWPTKKVEDSLVSEIIDMAKRFEEYTTGSLDVEDVLNDKEIKHEEFTKLLEGDVES